MGLEVATILPLVALLNHSFLLKIIFESRECASEFSFRAELTLITNEFSFLIYNSLGVYEKTWCNIA